MKKFLILFTLVSAILSFTSCSCFDIPANAKKIGTGYVKSDKGELFVEIDSVKYTPVSVYTGSITRGVRTKMEPVIGMQVTVLYVHELDTPTFIAGDLTEEVLEEQFSENHSFRVIFGALILAGMIICCTMDPLKRKDVRKK